MVADRLRGLVRETDTIARMGGDEFAILQVDVGQPPDADSLWRIASSSDDERALRHRWPAGGDRHQRRHRHRLRRRHALRPADAQRRPRALSRQGRGPRHLLRSSSPRWTRRCRRARLWRPTCARRWRRANSSSTTSRSSISSSNRDHRLEALIRWHHPDTGLVLPATSSRWPRRSACIVPLGEWVLREACAAAASWPDALTVVVNLSPAQFRSPGLVAGGDRARWPQSGLAAERLELEITETVLLEDSEATLATLLSAARRSACGSRWTTSAPAIPRSATCRASRSTRSRSTARSSKDITDGVRLAQHRARGHRHGARAWA